jgi:hypothetical protein
MTDFISKATQSSFSLIYRGVSVEAILGIASGEFSCDAIAGFGLCLVV